MEAIELPFCAKEGFKKKTGILVKVVKDTQQQINPAPEVELENCVAVILWLYSSVLII